jgi:hypothetical protein
MILPRPSSAAPAWHSDLPNSVGTAGFARRPSSDVVWQVAGARIARLPGSALTMTGPASRPWPVTV